ncbi:unnamed protein product, partial [Mesorhabditis belari]|uniref:SKP1 component dimerisation domain-containing protein n=1 Tax=Mesorhabditis belari TaxID=2138241 RepID=A0AAF3F7Z0_9BILA
MDSASKTASTITEKPATAVTSFPETGILKSPGSQLILETTDGVQHFIDRSDALLLGTVTRMLQDLNLETSTMPVLRMPVCFKTETLINLLQLSRELAKLEPKEKKASTNGKQTNGKFVKMEEWKKKLKAIPKPLLFDMAEASNFLDAKGVYEALVQQIADNIKSMSIEEMRVYFDVKSDLTPSQLKKIQKEFDFFRVCASLFDFPL